MATYYTDLTDASNTQRDAHTREDSRLAGSQLLLATATYTTNATSETSSDFINIVELPAGAVVVPSLSRVLHEDIGTELVFDIGDASDANRYALAVTLGTNAGVKYFIAEAATALPAAVTTPYTIPTPAANANDDRLIVADITTATSITASQTIIFEIVYRVRR